MTQVVKFFRYPLALFSRRHIRYFKRLEKTQLTVPVRCTLLASITLPIVPTVNAAFWSSAPPKAPEKEESKQTVVEKADALYDDHSYDELYSLLQDHKTSNNAELVWRLARVTCDKAKITSNAEEKKTLMYEAYELAKQAVALDDNNFACHKWYAIMLNYIGEYEGSKKQIGDAYIVKKHLEKAIELNNKDATSIHILGVWCYTVADLPWYKRKIASALFATPPTSSYQEALKHFENAEKVDPNFYSQNLLMLGKTYLKLDLKKKALLYLTKARDYPVKTEDDKQAVKEAVELLKSITK